MPKIIRIVTRLNVGGPAQQAVALSEEMPKRGWETLLVTGTPGLSEGDMEYLLTGKNIRCVHIPFLKRELRPLADLRAWWAILRILWREKPAVIHTHMAKGGALGRSAGLVYRWLTGASVKMVHTFHGHVLQGYFNEFGSFFFKGIERFLASFTDVLIAVSPQIREDLVGMKVAQAQKIRVVALGLPLGPLLEVSPLDPPGPLRIGVVGRLVPIKNHALLLEAIRILAADSQIDGARFLLVGDGELRSSLKSQALRLGIFDYVQFLGWRSDLRAVYESLHMVCLTSLNEGTPVALIEAMAAARPVVAADVGGVRNLLQGEGAYAPGGGSAIPKGSYQVVERGILVSSGDAQGFAKALSFLMHHPEECRRLKEAGRRFVEQRFSLEQLVCNLNQLYRELIAA